MSNQGRESSDGAISLLAGIGVGLLLGGIAALLLAPQSGEATRAQIKESADDALVKLKDSMEDLRVKVEEVASNTRQAVAGRMSSSAAGTPQGDAAGATEEPGAPAA